MIIASSGERRNQNLRGGQQGGVRINSEDIIPIGRIFKNLVSVSAEQILISLKV
jgi:hypothetical protein